MSMLTVEPGIFSEYAVPPEGAGASAARSSGHVSVITRIPATMKNSLKSNSGAVAGRFPLRIPIKRSIVVLIVAWAGGCASLGGSPKGPPLQRNEYVRLLMGVRMRIVAYAPDEATARAAAAAAFERVAQLE